MTTLRGVRAAAVTALIAAVPGTLTAQVTIAPGASIPGGQPLTAPLAGISFAVPDGFTGGWQPDAAGLVFESADGMLLGAWGWSEGTVEEVVNVIDGRLVEMGLQTAPRDIVEATEEALTAVFDVRSANGTGLLNAAVRRGEDGNIFAVAILGGPGSAADLQQHVDAVLASLEFTRPGASTWRAEVEGVVLLWSSSGSDMSSGTTTATGASSSEATLALCPGGVYRYSESSESYVSIEGVSASNSSADGHAGQWWISADISGQAVLTLETTDGRVFYWSVEETADGVLVDGYRYVPNGSC